MDNIIILNEPVGKLANSNKPWSREENMLLKKEFNKAVYELAKKHKRSRTAIKCRIRRLHLTSTPFIETRRRPLIGRLGAYRTAATPIREQEYDTTMYTAYGNIDNAAPQYIRTGEYDFVREMN